MLRFATLGVVTGLISMLIGYVFPDTSDPDDSNPFTVPHLLELLLWLIVSFVVGARSHSKREVVVNSAVVFVALVFLGLLSAEWPTIADRFSPPLFLLLPPILLLGFAFFTAPALLIFFLLGPPSLDSEAERSG
jgi:hypothetical protein